MSDDSLLRPECGWTGERADLEAVGGVRSCPICDTDVEFVE